MQVFTLQQTKVSSTNKFNSTLFLSKVSTLICVLAEAVA
jgi:hypothetical protein